MWPFLSTFYMILATVWTFFDPERRPPWCQQSLKDVIPIHGGPTLYPWDFSQVPEPSLVRDGASMRSEALCSRSLWFHWRSWWMTGQQELKSHGVCREEAVMEGQRHTDLHSHSFSGVSPSECEKSTRKSRNTWITKQETVSVPLISPLNASAIQTKHVCSSVPLPIPRFYFITRSSPTRRSPVGERNRHGSKRRSGRSPIWSNHWNDAWKIGEEIFL